jgi:hypothetical protein
VSPDTGAREPQPDTVSASDEARMKLDAANEAIRWVNGLRRRGQLTVAIETAERLCVHIGELAALAAGVGVPPDKDSGGAPARERQDARAEVSEMLADLRELADHPLSYGQETHGELHADALAHIERCEEAIRKILEGGEDVRHQGLVEACAIYNERRKEPRKTGWDALSDANKVEWAAMVAEMRDPETKACRCGYPTRECLRVVLRNGPPYPPRPCEAKL